MQVSAADQRVTELEDEFGPARDELIRRENENRSLRASLDLVVSDNSRLCHHLAERNAAINNAHS